MDYKKIYDSIINKAKLLDRKKGGDTYYEYHHIIPICLGGKNIKENKVLLTAREHYVCHKILFKTYPENTKLAFAYHSMVYSNKYKRNLKLSSRDFEDARMARSNALKGKKQSPEHIQKRSSAMKLVVRSEEHNRNISLGKKGIPSKFKNVPRPQYVKDKISKKLTGTKMSDSAKLNMSISGKGKQKSKEHNDKNSKAKINFYKNIDEETRNRLNKSVSDGLNKYWENIRQERALMIF